jgi:zinc transport system permease protein
MADFLRYALMAGLPIAAIAGPLGCFVVWQRMAYFGDTLAHAALLGVALSLLTNLPLPIAVAIVSLVLAALLARLSRQPQLQSDSLLGVIAHGSLALALVLLSVLPLPPIDMESYLFGDLLAVQTSDILVIFSLCSVIAILLWRYWQSLLAMTLDSELAAAEGLPVAWLRTLLLILIALLVACAIRIVGALLITALLIIPAACARQWSRSPEQMALVASVVGIFSVLGGLAMSLQLDSPTGPSIVTVSAGIFLLSRLRPIHA